MSISVASKYIDGMRLGLGFDLSVTVDPLSGSSFSLTKTNIVQGSFVIDRSVCSGDVLEIGSAMAAEMSFKMKNEPFTDPDGNNIVPASIVFEGAELTVNLTLYNPTDSETFTLPLGVFTVDEPPRKLSTITIKALDRMMRFDVAHDGAVGSSLLVVVQHCCDLAGVTLSSSAITFLNSFTGIYTLPEAILDKENLVCRQVLMWVGEMTASCAYVDENGYLNFKQYPQTHLGAMVITEADRYSSDMQESDITITGITVTPTDSENKAVTIGAQGYEWNIEGNRLLVSPDEMASAPLGYSDKKFFAYRPFTASTKSFPHLWPLDAIVFSKTTNNVTEMHNSVITHHTWKLNGNSSISAVGKTATKNGYATHGGFTTKQKAVIERTIKGQVKTQISGYQQSLININMQAFGALGLYSTTDKDSGITYYHNQPDIADSTYIYMESTAGRFMATGANAWNDGSPVWTGAWTSMGEVVANSLSAGSITSDLLSVGTAANAHNLAINGDFSMGAWKGDLARYTYENSNFNGSCPVGEKTLRVKTGSSTESYPAISDSYYFNVTGSTVYTASFYLYNPSAEDTRHKRMLVQWYDDSGKFISNSEVYALSAYIAEANTGKNGQWHRYKRNVTSPDNAATARLGFYIWNTNEFDDNYIYIGGFMLEEGSLIHDWDNGQHKSNVIIDTTGINIYNGAIAIYQGGSNSSGKILEIKADEEGNAYLNGNIRANSLNVPDGYISTKMCSIGNIAKTVNNLFTNGDFSTPSQWTKEGFNKVSIETSHVFGFSIPVGHFAVRLYIGSNEADYPKVLCNSKIEVEYTEYYTASFYVKREFSADNRLVRMCIDWYDSYDTYCESSYIDDVYSSDTATSWKRINRTVLSPSSASYARISCYMYDTTGASTYDEDYVYIAGLMLEKGEELHDWDNGKTVNNTIITEEGISIYNGAIYIYNDEAEPIFSVNKDNSGNMYISGSIQASSINARTCDISLNNTKVGSIDGGYIGETPHLGFMSAASCKGIVFGYWEPSGTGVISVQIPNRVTNPSEPSMIVDSNLQVGTSLQIGSSSTYWTIKQESGYSLRVSYNNNDSDDKSFAFDGNNAIFYAPNVYGNWINATSLSANSVDVTSDMSEKTNINKSNSMLNKLRHADICHYNYISDTKNKFNESGDFVETQGTDFVTSAPTHYGLVIGEGYNTPSEVISPDGKHINLYSMISLAWKAIQELADMFDDFIPTEVK